MLIRKISLKNFRNFKNCEINFSCDKEKNFTIILGQNTYGKTTLINAFIWCLYKVNQFKNKTLLNSDVADSMMTDETETVKVEVELEHNNCSYKITTKEEYKKNSNGEIVCIIKAKSSMIKISGYNSIPIRDSYVDEEIESILRPELRDYFFFDGETNSIESISTKKNLTNAVTNILGLNKIEMIKDYYDPYKKESVISCLNRELESSDDLQATGLQFRLNKVYEKQNKLNGSIKDCKDEINRLELQLEEQNNILDANKDIEKEQAEKKRLDREITTDESDKERMFDGLIMEFNNANSFLKVLFATSFKKFDIKDIMETSNFREGNSYKGISEEAVDSLVSAGRCICGALISNNNEAYLHLMEAKKHMEPHDYGKYISDFVSAESANVFHAKTTLDNIISDCGKIVDVIERIDDNRQRSKNISERIAGRADVGQIQININNINRQLGAKQNELDNIEKIQLPENNKEIREINEIINKASIKSKENDFIKLCIEYASSIYEAACQNIEISKTRIREELQKEVGNIFKSMYHGNREIIIDDGFRASTIVTSSIQDKNLDKSTGLGTVINYSFVAGLMKLAKNSIIKNDDDIDDSEATDNVYPLIMDAPFSNTDDEHIRNICKALPNYCDQVIMFVMKKDYNYASDSISNRVGKSYAIKKISETEAEIMEEI